MQEDKNLSTLTQESVGDIRKLIQLEILLVKTQVLFFIQRSKIIFCCLAASFLFLILGCFLGALSLTQLLSSLTGYANWVCAFLVSGLFFFITALIFLSVKTALNNAK
jgi:uncharacterized membrane protein